MKKILLSLFLFIVLVFSGCTKPSEQSIAPAQDNKPNAEQPIVGDEKAITSDNNQTEASSSTEKDLENPASAGCTEEARLCPDGTAVGRSGPNCEFAPCSSRSCSCPEGFYQEGETCNPDCYKKEPRCLQPSIACTPEKECGTCPMLSQPAPGFCVDGTIVAGEKDECGCQSPPKCEKSTDSGGVGLANPASVYCNEQGGKSEIITNADGSQSGNCVLSSGKICDEWQYFRGECE